MAKQQKRWNPWGGCEYTPNWPNGIPQYTMVSGLYRRNWKTPDKENPSSMNPKLELVHDRRFGFAQMWRTPRGVGYYGGNQRASDGGWTVRVCWDERDISLGYIDYPLAQITPIFRLPSGKTLKTLWRKQGHIKSKPKKPPTFIIKLEEAEPDRPAVGSRVEHFTLGPGTVLGVTGPLKGWYAEVRFDASPFGPLEHAHEFSSEVFHGPWFGIKAAPRESKMVFVRNVREKYPTKNMGCSVTALEEARAQGDRDATEFYVTADGNRGRRGTRVKNTNATKDRAALTNEKL